MPASRSGPRCRVPQTGTACLGISSDPGRTFFQTLHADTACEFTQGGDAWVVRRADTMLQVFAGGGGPIASIRPHALGEAWLVGILGASARNAAGLPDLPEVEPLSGLELVQRGGRWMSQGANVVQISTERAARVAEFVFGRSLEEVRALLEV